MAGVDCRRFRLDNTADLPAGDAAEASDGTRVAPLASVVRRRRKPPSVAGEHGWCVEVPMVARKGNHVLWPAPSREHGAGVGRAEYARCGPVPGCGSDVRLSRGQPRLSAAGEHGWGDSAGTREARGQEQVWERRRRDVPTGKPWALSLPAQLPGSSLRIDHAARGPDVPSSSAVGSFLWKACRRVAFLSDRP